MDFSLHQLSASNLASIFHIASIDAEPVDDNFCLVRKQYHSSVWTNLEKKLLQFSTHFSLYCLSEDEIRSHVSKLNNEIDSIKVTYDNYMNPDGSRDISLSYAHIVNEDTLLSTLTILTLHKRFESLAYQAALICREAYLKQAFAARQIELL